MEVPSGLLEQALILYHEELERNIPEDQETVKQQLSAEIKAALPETVREYLQVTRLPNGGHQFWLIIPGCLPILLSFNRRMSGLELKLATVVSEERPMPWSTTNLMLAIGYARDLYIQGEAGHEEWASSDIGMRNRNV